MTDDWTKEIRARLTAATPGPWYAIIDPEDGESCLGIGRPKNGKIPKHRFDFEEAIIRTDSGVYPPDAKTAIFIANAPQDIAHLLEALRVKDETLKEIASTGFWDTSAREDLIESIRYMRDSAKNILDFDPTKKAQEDGNGI